jgi:hypothetical protein
LYEYELKLLEPMTSVSLFSSSITPNNLYNLLGVIEELNKQTLVINTPTGMFYIKISPVTFLKARASVFCTIMITSLV